MIDKSRIKTCNNKETNTISLYVDDSEICSWQYETQEDAGQMQIDFKSIIQSGIVMLSEQITELDDCINSFIDNKDEDNIREASKIAGNLMQSIRELK